jgi:uncharacterized protein (TIGR03083 family)
MSHQGIAAMTLAGNDILAIADSLSPAEWATPSAAQGWTIKDVVTHVGQLTAMLIAAVQGQLPEPETPTGVERLNDQLVAQHDSWTPHQAIESFRTLLDAGTTAFAALQDGPAAASTAPLLDLGTFPLHAIADMFAFDYSTHLRWDILTPRGPLHRDLPPLDAARLKPAVSWLLGGIPQMQPGLASHLSSPIQLTLTGPAAHTAILSVNNATGRIAIDQRPDGAAAAEIISTTNDFLAWATQRIPWQDAVTVDGDTTVAEDFLNNLNLV